MFEFIAFILSEFIFTEISIYDIFLELIKINIGWIFIIILIYTKFELFHFILLLYIILRGTNILFEIHANLNVNKKMQSFLKNFKLVK